MLQKGSRREVRALFQFDSTYSDAEVEVKFNLWARYFHPKFFKSEDAPFHSEMDKRNMKVYRGEWSTFLDIGFRGCAKTTKLKLFIAFCIANDTEHKRKYFKVLSEERANAVQIVTDVYNLLIKKRVQHYYPEIFEKTEEKRQETMSTFTTSTGVKMQADSVGTDQRGDIQEESRPDILWFDDFETRKTLRSAVITQAIWDNMDEAYTGLAKGGGAIYNCNYLSERGNVHKLVVKHKNHTLITPILKKDGEPSWSAYTKEEVGALRNTVEDFAGDYMCEPSMSDDIYFDRAMLDRMETLEPVRVIGGFKIFKEYVNDHTYALGHDVAGGVGLDSSTSVAIDFSTTPAQVVATFRSNTILPEAFGAEIYEEANIFGGCLTAIENNKYDQTVLKAKQLGVKLFKMPAKGSKIYYSAPKMYGWNTNSLTKTQMLSALKKAIADGSLVLNDEELVLEAKGYTRNDLIESTPDVRLVTNHFDLLIACAIAWQMKDHVEFKNVVKSYLPNYKPPVTKVNPAL